MITTDSSKKQLSTTVSSQTKTSAKNSAQKQNTKSEGTQRQGSGHNRKTQSYRHVDYEPRRPELTREGNTLPRKKNEFTQSKKSQGKKTTNADVSCRIIPLGGLDAIGKNMTVFETKNSLIDDDAGLMFPDDNHPGIDLILPDYTYILDHVDKLCGIFITHGHEDHTGALPYLLKDLDREVPVYGTKLTLGLIEGKLAER